MNWLPFLGINPGFAIAMDSHQRREDEEKERRRRQEDKDKDEDDQRRRDMLQREAAVEAWLNEPGYKGRLVVSEDGTGIQRDSE